MLSEMCKKYLDGLKYWERQDIIEEAAIQWEHAGALPNWQDRYLEIAIKRNMRKNEQEADHSK